MSSCILSEPVDVSQYGLIYFGVQKNVAPAGMAVVIVREDLIGHARPATPAMLDYATVIGANSMYNTPPCFCIYMMGLVLEWLENEVGGLAAMQRRNEEKAALLYDYLDASRFFKNPVEKPFRSMMNVTFTSPLARTGQSLLCRGRPKRPCEPEGPPQRGRHARLYLQCHAPGGRAGPGGVHAEV